MRENEQWIEMLTYVFAMFHTISKRTNQLDNAKIEPTKIRHHRSAWNKQTQGLANQHILHKHFNFIISSSIIIILVTLGILEADKNGY